MIFKRDWVRRAAELYGDMGVTITQHQRRTLQDRLRRLVQEPPWRVVAEAAEQLERAGPDELLAAMRQLLGLGGLHLWLSERPAAVGRLGDLGVSVADAIQSWLATTDVEKSLDTGLRLLLGIETESEQIESSIFACITTQEEEGDMSLSFKFDPRRLPSALQTDAAQLAYVQTVARLVPQLDLTQDELKGIYTSAGGLGLKEEDPRRIRLAAIVGALLQKDVLSPTEYDIQGAAMTLERTVDEGLVNGTLRKRLDYYKAVAKELEALKKTEVFFRELQTVADYAIERAREVTPEGSNFRYVVELGISQYVGGPAPSDSLDLPPLLADDGHEQELVKENIRAVGVLYAAYQLEQVRLIHVVDRITEMFLNGQLPIGYDEGGKALDAYYWDADRRLDEGARRMQYSRVLGVPGGDVSREVVPNTEFDSLLMRFVASIADRARDERVSTILNAQRPASSSDAQVRKTGRDLGANASLYGWAATQFAARRINAHIRQAIEVLKQPTIQKALGVTNPWQVVERVASTDLGQTPNIPRYRTMALAGHKLLDIIAQKSRAFGASTTLPLIDGDLDRATWDEMVRHAEYFLAVNGIKDDQVDQLSQPEQVRGTTSLPAYGGAGGATGGLDQLRSMIATGQQPSMDQLRTLIPGIPALN